MRAIIDGGVLFGGSYYVPLYVFNGLVIDAYRRAYHRTADHSLVCRLAALRTTILVDADLKTVVDLQVDIIVPSARLLDWLLLRRRGSESDLLLMRLLISDLDQLAMELGYCRHRWTGLAKDSRRTRFAQLFPLHAN